MHVISLIHDEILIKTPENLAMECKQLLSSTMESAMDLGVPIVADSMVVDNWGQCKLKDYKRILRYIHSDFGIEQMALRLSHLKEEQLKCIEENFDKWKMISNRHVQNVVAS